jgi:hypothetical protein
MKNNKNTSPSLDQHTDEGHSIGNVEVNTAGLGDTSEVNLDRSEVGEEGQEMQSEGEGDDTVGDEESNESGAQNLNDYRKDSGISDTGASAL